MLDIFLVRQKRIGVPECALLKGLANSNQRQEGCHQNGVKMHSQSSILSTVNVTDQKKKKKKSHCVCQNEVYICPLPGTSVTIPDYSIMLGRRSPNDKLFSGSQKSTSLRKSVNIICIPSFNRISRVLEVLYLGCCAGRPMAVHVAST